jgi:hypothetical protein
MVRRWADFAARRGARRGRVAPILFFLILAGLVLSPVLFSGRVVLSAGGDLSGHLSGIVEATWALERGQFPIRVTPTSNDSISYPFFAYYGNFPYTAAGMLCQYFGSNPFTAWKIVHLLSLTVGGFFVFRCCEVLSRRTLPSIVGGAVFVLAPYMWIDTQVRWAFPEVVAFSLLPAVLFFSFRSFMTRRKVFILLAGAAWSLLSLSHNIVYLYGSLFFGLLFGLLFMLSLFRRQFRKSVRRLLRVGLGYALGMMLSLWYLVPQFYTLDYIGMGGYIGLPIGGDVLSPPKVLFAPVLTEPLVGGTPNMGLQVGWPILAGCLLALFAIVRPRTARRMRWMLCGLLCVFALSLLMVAMPSKWWTIIPRMFHFVQSTYRLLMFVVLFGAILSSMGLAASRLRTIRLRGTLFALLLVALASISYIPRHAPLAESELQKITERPDLGNNGAKLNFLPNIQAAARTSLAHPDVNFTDAEYGLIAPHGWLSLRSDGSPAHTYVPRSAVRGGGTIVIKGTLSRKYGKAPARLSVTLGKVTLPETTLGVAPKKFRVALPLPPEPPGDEPLLLTMWADRYPIQDQFAFQIHRVSFVPATKTDGPLARPGKTHGLAMKGGKMRYHVELDKPGFVQMPFLYYPGVLRMRVDRAEVPLGNIGPYLAVPLEAGPHRISVWYAGIDWANVTSGVGWIGVILGVLICTVTRWCRRYRGSRVSHRSAFPLSAALISITLIGSVLLAPTAWRVLRRQLRAGPAFTVTASHQVAEFYSGSNAFDDNETTQWVAPVGRSEASLMLSLAKPAKLRKATFEARREFFNAAWATIRVKLFLNGQQVSVQKFFLPKAATQPAVEVGLEPVLSDRIEFHFSSPVNVGRDGVTPVDVRMAGPGYREIRLAWEK